MAMEEFLRASETASIAAVHASGCSAISDFLVSPQHCKAEYILLCDGRSSVSPSKFAVRDWGTDGLCFSETHLREEEGASPGNIARCLHALVQGAIPTCRELEITGIGLTSVEISQFCHGLASRNCTLEALALSDIHFILTATDNSEAAFVLLWEAIQNNLSLKSLSIDANPILCPEAELASLLSRTDCPIKTLMLNTSSDFFFYQQYIFTLLAQSNATSLTCLWITNRHATPLSLSEKLPTMLHTNKSLISLHIRNFHMTTPVFDALLKSLENNRHLTALSLSHCEGPWSLSSLLDSLRANGILGELDLTGTPLANNTAIPAQLARNRENAQRIKVLRSKGMLKVPPTAVRLFICGLPYSGKTTLSRSMVKCLKDRHCFSCVKGTILDRTRGIEVTFIKKDGIKVSLWDMAGQAEFHSFHDHMFPNLSNQAMPSFFLFVWNPIEIDDNGHEQHNQHGRIMTKTLQKFHEELKYWLKFIASKTLRSKAFRPRLMVAITRADHRLPDTKTWLESTFMDLQRSFEGIIQFDMDEVFEVDARDPDKVAELALQVFECAKRVLQAVPHVYQACDDARMLLANLVQSKRIAPLISREEFDTLCTKYLGIDSGELHEAIALSLNDSGDLIYLTSLQFVVVDTQWFCHQVMGDLLFYSMQNKSNNDRNLQGFFSLEHLGDLLERQVNSAAGGKSWHFMHFMQMARRRAPKVQGEDLVKLLIGLQLACPRDSSQNNSDIFIPASISHTKTIKSHMVHHKSDTNSQMICLGRRLKCKDSDHTFLAPGLFPMLQVTLHNIFEKRKVKVHLEKDAIAFACEGIEVFVEFCGQGGEDHFIDVLIWSCLDLDSTIYWVYENVIDNIGKLCAEPRGIQGVELAHAVIRPSCVEQSVTLEERKTQAVSVEELRNVLEKCLQRVGFEKGFRNAFHTWQPSNISDRVVDLIGEVESLRVSEAYWHGLSAAAEDALDIAVEEKWSKQEEKVFGSTPSAKEREAIFSKLMQVHRDVQKIGSRIENLRKVVLPELQERMREMLTFVKDGEAGKLPRMYVVTADHNGLRRRIVAAMVPGLQNVRLQLLCEHRSKPHLVVGQPGLAFATLEDGLLKRGLPYINAFLKLAQLAVKVGAHVTAGLANTIPDFTHLLALIVDTSDLPAFPTLSEPSDSAPASSSSTSRVHFQEGQQWLFDVLSKRDCLTGAQIYSIFRLSRVRYPDSRVGWLCNEHCSEGEPWPT